MLKLKMTIKIICTENLFSTIKNPPHLEDKFFYQTFLRITDALKSLS